MLIGGILEWVLGNSFASVVFCSFGGFWFSYGATLTPAFATFASYAPADATSSSEGLQTTGFNASLGILPFSLPPQFVRLSTNVVVTRFLVSIYGCPLPRLPHLRSSNQYCLCCYLSHLGHRIHPPYHRVLGHGRRYHCQCGSDQSLYRRKHTSHPANYMISCLIT